jgi:hypothetical protein
MAVKLLILVSLVGLSWFAFYCFASRLFAPGPWADAGHVDFHSKNVN